MTKTLKQTLENEYAGKVVSERVEKRADEGVTTKILRQR